MSNLITVVFKIKSTLPCVTGVVKLFCPLLPGGGVGGAIQAIVVDVPEPLAFTFRHVTVKKSAATTHQYLCFTKPSKTHVTIK